MLITEIVRLVEVIPAEFEAIIVWVVVLCSVVGATIISPFCSSIIMKDGKVGYTVHESGPSPVNEGVNV